MGNAIITSVQAQILNAAQGTIAIAVNVEGLWVFLFSATQKAQLAHLIAGKSKGDAPAILQSQQGVNQANIQISGDSTTLPDDPGQITIVVQNITGLS